MKPNQDFTNLQVTALAGGVGGAKLADGLAAILPGSNFTCIVNTGDDFTHLGLRICPDLDTVCYTLSGLANPKTGWGAKDETWNCLAAIRALGGEDWFALGDRDLGLHLSRTARLNAGDKLSSVVEDFCRRMGIRCHVVPMSDDPVATMIETQEMGWLPFQEYFVKYHFLPKMMNVKFAGIERARPAKGVLEAIAASDVIVICPSNPWVSIQPILSVSGIEAALTGKVVIAVSPIIQGKTIKGPAAKMYAEMGIDPTAAAVAKHYKDFLTGFVLDQQDTAQGDEICQWGIIPNGTNTIMKTRNDRIRLAREVLVFAKRLLEDRYR